MTINDIVTTDEVVVCVARELDVQPWRSLWQYRVDLRDLVIVSYGGRDRELLLSVATALTIVNEIRSKSQQLSSGTLPVSKVFDPFVQLAFFAWVYLLDYPQAASCPKIFAPPLAGEITWKSPQIVHIVNLYGARLLLARLIRELVTITRLVSNATPSSEYSEALLVVTLGLVPGVCGSSSAAPLVASSGIFGASLGLHLLFSTLCMDKDWRETSDVKEVGRVVAGLSTIDIFLAIDHHQKGKNGTPGVYLALDPAEVVVVLTRCLHILHPENVPTLSRKHIEKIERVFRTHPAHSAPRSVVDAFRPFLTETVWYHEFNGIKTRLSKHHDQPEAKAIKSVERRWIEWGEIAGIKVASARKKYEREKAKYCCWPECQFFTTPSPSPLLSCRGCSEFRYCSQEHQRRDWKEGGHKSRCKRLPAP